MHRIDKIRALSDTILGCIRAAKVGGRILVIESDDWGSIRSSSTADYERLCALGWPMRRSPYGFDALETLEDLRGVLKVLHSFRDNSGNPACMTANMVMANPDFDRIRASGFTQYYFTPVVESIGNDPLRRELPELWIQGMEQGTFTPQLHAREHVCWWRWLEALRNGSEEARVTFEMRMCGVPLASSKENQSFFTPLYVADEELSRYRVDLETLIADGYTLFVKAFGFAPVSTVPPSHHWSPAAEVIWAKLGIRYIQGQVRQRMGSGLEGERIFTKLHYSGERNVHDMMYLIRNVVFEPCLSGINWIDKAMRQIRFAFLTGQPAVINTHRHNYIGSINEENGKNGLAQLSRLLKGVLKKWPDVKFMATPALGKLIRAEQTVA